MNIAIFCGSSSGNSPLFTQAAQALAHSMAARDIGLVYGGGRVGLMGVVADAMLSAGGNVIGIIPQSLADKELAHQDLSELHIVADMHERKASMAERADAFIALPGGAGTLEEIFEAWTWAQLGLHNKPCGFLNVDAYYDKLLSFIDGMVAQGFMKATYREMLQVDTQPEALLNALQHYQPPVMKWANPTAV
ncbi:TIGR00730 family Rossman fold protein [Neisseriaceae bacterium TC5R-5]|nr:TIGR00730 family Rossman fold protein [Neisseriaceae bacterium TC5R-5]